MRKKRIRNFLSIKELTIKSTHKKTTVTCLYEHMYICCTFRRRLRSANRFKLAANKRLTCFHKLPVENHISLREIFLWTKMKPLCSLLLLFNGFLNKTAHLWQRVKLNQDVINIFDDRDIKGLTWDVTSMPVIKAPALFSYLRLVS